MGGHLRAILLISKKRDSGFASDMGYGVGGGMLCSVDVDESSVTVAICT